MDLAAFKEQLFTRGTAAGFTEMEISYQRETTTSSTMYKGALDAFTVADEGGLSFRGLYHGKMGEAYTEKIDEAAIDQLLAGARASAEAIDSEEERILFAGSDSYHKINLYAPALEEITPERQVDLLRAAESAAYALDPRVINVAYCTLGTMETERMIANTQGLALSERSNGGYVYLMAVVREGADIRSAMQMRMTQRLHQVDPEALAQEAVEEALSYLGATPVPSGPYPVLLRHTAAADLLQAFVRIFYAEDVQKGRSLLKGKLGEPIAAPGVTIVDDPFLSEGFYCRSFDSEGVATQRLAMVKEGVLQTYLYNLKTALVDGVAPTGHGHKPSYKGAVGTAPSNMFVQPGAHSFEELVAAMDEGVVITDVQGTHAGTNPISGDFSLAAHGYYVKGGRIERPVAQITVAGNFLTMLGQVEAVGNDLKFGYPMGSYIGSPTLKIKELAISGT